MNCGLVTGVGLETGVEVVNLVASENKEIRNSIQHSYKKRPPALAPPSSLQYT